MTSMKNLYDGNYVCQACGGCGSFLTIHQYESPRLDIGLPHLKPFSAIYECQLCDGTGKVDWIKRVSFKDYECTEYILKIYQDGMIVDLMIFPFTKWEINQWAKKMKAEREGLPYEPEYICMPLV